MFGVMGFLSARRGIREKGLVVVGKENGAWLDVIPYTAMMPDITSA